MKHLLSLLTLITIFCSFNQANAQNDELAEQELSNNEPKVESRQHIG